MIWIQIQPSLSQEVINFLLDHHPFPSFTLPTAGLCPHVGSYMAESHMGGFCCPLQGYVPHGLILLLPTTGLCPTWAETFVAHYRVMSEAKLFVQGETFAHCRVMSSNGLVVLLPTAGLCPLMGW